MMALSISTLSLTRGSDGIWRSIASYGLSEFVQRATRIATTVFIARTLTPLELGLAASALAVFEIVRVAANSGVGQSVIRASDADLAATCRSAHRLGWIICIGLMFLQSCIAAAVYAWTGRPDVCAMTIALAFVYLAMPAGLVQSYLLQRQASHSQIAWIATIQAVVDNVLTIALALLGFGAWAIVLPKVLTSPIWLIGMRRARPWSPNSVEPSRPSLPLLQFALPLIASDLLTMARSQLDRVLVGTMLGVEALGIYYFVSSAGAGLSHALTTALSTSIYPHFASASADAHLLLTRLDDSLRRKALPIAGAILLQAALAPIYVPILFGPKWAPFAWMVAVPCAAQACKVFSDTCAQALRAAGMAHLDFVGTIVITTFGLLALAIGLTFGLNQGVITFGVAVGALQIAVAAVARKRLSKQMG